MSEMGTGADRAATRPVDETVDAVVGRPSAWLDDLPVSEHVAVFERAHEHLRQVLSGAGERTPATQS